MLHNSPFSTCIHETGPTRTARRITASPHHIFTNAAQLNYKLRSKPEWGLQGGLEGCRCLRGPLIDCICPLAVVSASVQPPCLKHCFSPVPMTTGPPCSLRAQPLRLLHTLRAVHGGLCRSPHYRFSHACAFWLLLGTKTPSA